MTPALGSTDDADDARSVYSCNDGLGVFDGNDGAR